MISPHHSSFKMAFFILPLLWLSACSYDEPEGVECVTAFDCGDGLVCEDGFCVESPDQSGGTDTETIVTDKATDEEAEAMPEADVSDEAIEQDAPIDDDQFNDTSSDPDEDEIPQDTLASDNDDIDGTGPLGDEDIEAGTEDDVTIKDDALPLDDTLPFDDGPLPDIDQNSDTTPPTVTLTSPAANETGVGIATTVAATFSEPMNALTLTPTTMTVKQDATPVNGAVSYDSGSMTATFTPASVLAYDTTYTVTVTTGAQDEAGNGLTVDHVFSFTTAVEEINECAPDGKGPCDDNGDAAATCNDTLGGYECSCSWGFEFLTGSCRNIDECTEVSHDCPSNAHCADATPGFTCICNDYYTGGGYDCTFCNTAGQCGAACAACGSGAPYCRDYGNGTSACVQCLEEGHCGDGTPHCLTSNNTCVQCRDNNDCNTGAGEVCSIVTHTCAANVCGDGVPGGLIDAFTETFEGGLPNYSNGDWDTSSTQKHTGSYSLKSGSVPDDGGTSSVSMLRYTDGQICFWYAGQSESFDKFRVYINGSKLFETSGDKRTWSEQCLPTTAGFQTLEFEYYKDTSNYVGWDAFYVDDIRFHEATTEQCEAGGQTMNCDAINKCGTVPCNNTCDGFSFDSCSDPDQWGSCS
ncbi:MAG TPA: Ig-like domain-containing protein [bacterium]|nr:Ig-like domain-containing protein [bacterium]